MAYDVNKTDGTLLTSIPDGTLDVSTSIRLVGKNYAGYGEVMAENLVAMLENFAYGTPPANPVFGVYTKFNPFQYTEPYKGCLSIVT